MVAAHLHAHVKVAMDVLTKVEYEIKSGFDASLSAREALNVWEELDHILYVNVPSCTSTRVPFGRYSLHFPSTSPPCLPTRVILRPTFPLSLHIIPPWGPTPLS